MSRWLARLIFFLLPHWRLYSTPWLRLWQENQRQAYITINRFSMIVVILAYLAHHYFVDAPLGLTQDPKWIWYRFGLATGGLICLFHTFHIGSSTQAMFYKAPLLLFGVLSSYLQTQSMLWYNKVPYLWGIVIPIIFTAILKMNTLASVLYCLGIYGLQFHHYRAANLEMPIILGACFTGLLFVAMTKRYMSAEVLNFIEHQEKIEIERNLVESKKQMIDQIQGFLPRVINERISKNIEYKKMSVLQSVEEELRPKEKMISCLYSDVRRYTQLSKDENFIKESLLPAAHEAIAIIEELGGIPRTIGDLIFTYFDSNQIQLNALCTLLAAHEICESTRQRNQNKELNQRVVRFLVMTTGIAIVGNMGGLDSAREITALGSCVNRSARIDELTKLEVLKKQISTNGVLMDHDSYFIVADLVNSDYLKEINLSYFNIKIRDFENEEQLWFLPFDSEVVYQLEKRLGEFMRDYNLRGQS